MRLVEQPHVWRSACTVMRDFGNITSDHNRTPESKLPDLALCLAEQGDAAACSHHARNRWTACELHDPPVTEMPEVRQQKVWRADLAAGVRRDA